MDIELHKIEKENLNGGPSLKGIHCDEKKKLGLKQFPWIKTIFMFLDLN